MNNLERQFEILVVGRVTGDLILDTDKLNIEIGDKFVNVSDKKTPENKYYIPTDGTPSKENDKVTSLIDLDSLILQLSNESYSREWGGGANNSALAAARYLMTKSPNLGLTLLSPNKPYLKIGPEVYDRADELDEGYNINHHFMNFTPINYSLIIGGNNKIIIRNKPKGTNIFSLRREHKGTIIQYINPNDGILINSLNDKDMTTFIAKTIYFENFDYYKSREAISKDETANVADWVHQNQFLRRPKHRKLVTVITPGLSRNTIVGNIMPYSTLVMNEADALKIFCGLDEEQHTRDNQDLRTTKILQTMAQMRHGMSLPRGIRRKMSDEHNNIYVTLGERGHLVAIKDSVYHLRVQDDISKKVMKAIHENQAATNGLGDAFAAGVIYQETRGEASNYVETAAVANTTLFHSLGMVEPTHQTQIKVERTYDLKDYT